MANTYSSLLSHVVFSTKGRLQLLNDSLRPKTFAYVGGIVRDLGGSALAVGGVADHIHILALLPTRLSVAEAVRHVKGGSSRWLNAQSVADGKFAWQVGYSAFSVSESGRDAVIRYIDDQAEHHRVLSFQDELRKLLESHRVEFDEQYLWG